MSYSFNQVPFDDYSIDILNNYTFSTIQIVKGLKNIIAQLFEDVSSPNEFRLEDVE